MTNLTWTKNKQKLTIANQTDVIRGASCRFIRISKCVGVKLYEKKFVRDWTFKRQKEAYKLGIAPRVGQRFNIILFHPFRRRYYGYLTEIANIRVLGKTNFASLSKIMKQAGFSLRDIKKDRNVGMLRGKPVCIDFDPISMS